MKRLELQVEDRELDEAIRRIGVCVALPPIHGIAETLAIPGEALWSIIAFQFLPLMTLVALVTVYFQRRTAHVYVSAFLSGILVTWIVVASQATHVGF